MTAPNNRENPTATVTAEGESCASPRLRYTSTVRPHSGAAVPITEHVHWCRVPLPVDLDHINVWLLDCGDGYVLVDTGMSETVCKHAWESLEAQMLRTKPLRAIFITHIHPDHVGLAAWLQARHRVPVLMSEKTLAQAEVMLTGSPDANEQTADAFFRSHGVTSEDSAELRSMFSPQRIANRTSGNPEVSRLVADGEIMDWGGRWTALETNGHAYGHLCLSNERERLLISGDQILPTISSNVSLTFRNVDMNPLLSYLTSLRRLRSLDASTLVLPSHGLPFIGLHQRVDDLLRHHHEKLERIAAVCTSPLTAVEVLPFMFRRRLSGAHLFLGLGETLAHLEYLVDDNRLRRNQDAHGTVTYSASQAV